MRLYNLNVRISKIGGADFGFDKISKTYGACRGEIGLVKKSQTIIAKNKYQESVALAA